MIRCRNFPLVFITISIAAILAREFSLSTPPSSPKWQHCGEGFCSLDQIALGQTGLFLSQYYEIPATFVIWMPTPDGKVIIKHGRTKNLLLSLDWAYRHHADTDRVFATWTESPTGKNDSPWGELHD